MSAAAAQLPDSAACAEADTDGGGDDAAELLEQAAQCLANSLALSSPCAGPPGKALAGPVQAADGSIGRGVDAPGAQEGSASGLHNGDESSSAAVAGQPGSAPDADSGSAAGGGAAVAGSSAAAAALPEPASAAGSAAVSPHAAGEGLHTGAEEISAENALPAHAEGGRWQAGVVRLAAQGASSWVALRRGDPRGALEHARALLQVGLAGPCGALILCCVHLQVVNRTLGEFA